MPMSNAARQYLDEALDYIEQRSVRRTLVDWVALRATAHREAATAGTPADTYPAIRTVLRALDDRHSFLVPADEAQRRGEGAWTGLGLHAVAPSGVIIQIHPQSPADRSGLAVGDVILAVDGQPISSDGRERPVPLQNRARVTLDVLHKEGGRRETIELHASPYPVHLLPSGRMVTESIGYLEIPEQLAGDDWQRESGEEYARVAQDIIRSLEEQGARQWIVDLRRNPGGDMYPMIAGVGPLLGEGTCCYFAVPGDARQPITYVDGAVSDSIRIWTSVPDPYRLRTANPPVAVLIGAFTASSGEFTALAFRNRPATRVFGQPTYGVPTGNETKPLSDGAILFLTVCLGADRSGEAFDGPIPPDEAVPSDWSAFGTPDDLVIARAIEWLPTA